MIRFHFEDHGQDFLFWDVEDDGRGVGKIVDAGPLQTWAWADDEHYVNLREPHGVGDRLAFTEDLALSMETGHTRFLNYPITRVEILLQRACRKCGCTQNNACLTDGVPCHWVAKDLCSACAAKETAA